ncbi:MAG: adenosylcobalamin-dependent ribonucleoside-diphosphate reductase [Candidatus Pacearchaeota archaeon]
METINEIQIDKKKEEINFSQPQKPVKTYSNEEAVKAAVEYFKGDELAGTVWVNKYALKDSKGNIFERNPDDMHWRIAREIERVELKNNYPNPFSAQEVYSLLKDFKYIVPQGSPMSGIGNNFQKVSLSNCFVIGHPTNSDSYGGILKIDEEQVQLMKRRGGVGHDLSHLRPKGSHVDNSALTSTGIVPFMERYSNSTREVAQDGRRGALMLTVSMKHPDAEDFIDAKMTPGKVTGANISIKIDDEFMKAVYKGEKYIQQYPVNSEKPLFTKEVDAQKIWKKIIHNAWKSAEPGVIFWDTIKRESIPDCYADLGFETISTNPCGEIPLCAYDSCRLLAINLYSYVNNPFTEDAEFNLELFKKHAHYAQKIMDDIIDLELEKIDTILEKIEKDPEKTELKRNEYELWSKIKNKALEGRRTGIGITAEGDMLAALGLRYGSEEAIRFSTKIHKIFAVETYKSSVNLAKERGPFPIYDFEREKNNPFIRRIFEESPELEKEMKKHGRRNISLLTVAPTGTVSIMTQTTSGIEPVFLPVYRRRRKVNPNDKNVKITFVDEVGDSWEEYNVFHHKFVDWMMAKGYNPAKEYSEEEIDELVKKSPYHKATSKDVDWVAKVNLQGNVQKWVDHSISVTINLPSDTSEELVDKIYREGWQSGCKGVTVYRDGSRSGVLISKNEKNSDLNDPLRFKRPKVLAAEVIRFNNNDEKWISFVGLKDGKPYEIFTGIAEDGMFPIPKNVEKGEIIKIRDEQGNARYDFRYKDKYGYENTVGGLSHQFNKEFWNYAKLISSVLRHEMPIENIVSLVDSLNFDSENINSWKAGVKRALKRYIRDGTKVRRGKCTECGSDELVYQEGCLRCSNCGSSKCG